MKRTIVLCLLSAAVAFAGGYATSRTTSGKPTTLTYEQEMDAAQKQCQPLFDESHRLFMEGDVAASDELAARARRERRNAYDNVRARHGKRSFGAQGD